MEKKHLQRRKNFPWTKSKGKVILDVFFYQKGLIRFEFIPEGQSVNKTLNIEFLDSYKTQPGGKTPKNRQAPRQCPYTSDLFST